MRRVSGDPIRLMVALTFAFFGFEQQEPSGRNIKNLGGDGPLRSPVTIPNVVFCGSLTPTLVSSPMLVRIDLPNLFAMIVLCKRQLATGCQRQHHQDWYGDSVCTV
jgi:hypothetical protein